MELPTPFPKTPLSRHGVNSLLPDLLRTLTSAWMEGPHWQTLTGSGSQKQFSKQTELVQGWSATLRSHFNSEHLKRLEEASGDYGRIVFLQLFEFTLFEVVKKVIVDERSGDIKGIQVAIDKITYASPLLLSPPSFIARSYVS